MPQAEVVGESLSYARVADLKPTGTKSTMQYTFTSITYRLNFIHFNHGKLHNEIHQ